MSNNKRKPGNAGKGISRDIRIWLGQHGRALVSSLGQIYKNPVGNLFSIAVIGVSLALPAGFYLILDNSQRMIENWEGNIQIALYLQTDVSDTRAREMQSELAAYSNIDKVRLVTREQALQEYKAFSGFAEALDALEHNPLPGMLLVEPDIETLSSDTGQQLLDQLGSLAEVESAQLDRQWIKRLFVILDILERMVLILTTLLSIAVMLIVGNTIRLSIINKRTEIEINKLFGATNAFIKRPFLYTGLLFGLSGSLLAWLLLGLSTLVVENPVNQLSMLYDSNFTLEGLSLAELTTLFATGGSLGLLGSWVAVGRHLREAEPR